MKSAAQQEKLSGAEVGSGDLSPEEEERRARILPLDRRARERVLPEPAKADKDPSPPISKLPVKTPAPLFDFSLQRSGPWPQTTGLCATSGTA